MTEDEAKEWVASRWPAEVVDRLERLKVLIADESRRQNLIAASTVDTMWSRHIVDSLQLIDHAGTGAWLDIGTGAGFPGLAVAVAEPERPMTLVEPRRLRAEFLERCVGLFELSNVSVEACKIQSLDRPDAAVISARAVSNLVALFDAAHHCANLSTTWLLPKGRGIDAELAEARRSWHGVFHVEHSVTSPDSRIVVATDVRRRR